MSIQQNKIRAIIEKIWSKVKTPQPMCGDDIVNAIDDVYTSGEDNGIAEFWKSLFGSTGEKANLRSRFAYANLRPSIFRPPFTITPTGSNCKELFYYCSATTPIDCVALEKELGYPVFDFSKNQHVEIAFSQCSAFSKLGVINLSATYETYMCFYYCTATYIEKIIVSASTPYNLTFRYFQNIEHCPFEGTIGKNGLDLTQSTKLDRESLLSVINCLADKTADTSGTVWKVTFGATNLAKLTDEEKAEIEAKGWTYA